MEELINEFSIYLKDVKNASDNTIASYKRDLLRMDGYMKKIGVIDISGITEDKLFNYISNLRDEHFAVSSLIRHITTIKSFFRYLLENGDLRDNPSENIKPPKAERSKPRVLTTLEVEKLLGQDFGEDAKGKRDRAILELLYATGILPTELIELKLENIDMSLNCLRFGENRVIPYGKKARDALNDYLLNARKQLIKDESEIIQEVFLNYKGTAMSRQGLWKLIKAYVKNAGIDMDVTPYSLRHSFAVNLIENGADAEVLQEMMGFSDPGAVHKYIEGKNKNKDPYEWARIRN